MMYMHHTSEPSTSHPDGPCACTTLRKASRAMSRAYEEALEPGGVTATQFAILRVLERAGPRPLSRLADELVMDRTSLYRAIRPLTQAGDVALDAGGRGRAKIAALTVAGRATIE